MNLSANFSRFREYSISISDFLRKKSCRSWRSCTLISVCCSRHFCCSMSWARISNERSTYPLRSVRIEQYQPKLQTLQHTSASQLHQLDLDVRSCGGTQQWQLSLLPPHAYALASSHPPSVSQKAITRAQDSAGLTCAEHLPPPSSPILCLASGISPTSGLEWSPCSRWCATIWAAAPSAALKNGRINKHPLGLGWDQPADCQVDHAGWYHHAHHGNTWW